MRFWNYFEFLTRCRKRHPFSSSHLKMTSKTKLILQLKNYEKNRSSVLTVFALSNKVSIQIAWRFFYLFFFILTTNTKRLCHIFLVDFKVSESLGLQLKQKREHNIYFKNFLKSNFRRGSYCAFMPNNCVRMHIISVTSWLLKLIDMILDISHIFKAFLYILS